MPRAAHFHAAREWAEVIIPPAPVVIVPLLPDLSPEERFILARLPIAARIARRFARYAPDLWADLFQEACLALVEVVRHAPAQTTPDHLEALAVLWMRRRIVLALARHSSAGQCLPAHALRDWLRLRRIILALQNALGREPTRVELADAVGWPPERVADLTAPVIPTPLQDVAEREAGDTMQRIALRRDALRVHEALARLPQPEQTIVAAQFGVGVPRLGVRELASRMHLAPRTVVALRRHGIILLRRMMLCG